MGFVDKMLGTLSQNAAAFGTSEEFNWTHSVESLSENWAQQEGDNLSLHRLLRLPLFLCLTQDGELVQSTHWQPNQTRTIYRRPVQELGERLFLPYLIPRLRAESHLASSPDANGVTPVHLAAWCGLPLVLGELLLAAENATKLAVAPTLHGRRPMDDALAQGGAEVVATLLRVMTSAAAQEALVQVRHAPAHLMQYCANDAFRETFHYGVQP
jgi:hypothetical protein